MSEKIEEFNFVRAARRFFLVLGKDAFRDIRTAAKSLLAGSFFVWAERRPKKEQDV
jgi:hypothetical protein